MTEDYTVQEELYKNVLIKIGVDTDPMNPFEEWDHAPTFGLVIDWDTGLDPADMRLMVKDLLYYYNDLLHIMYYNEYKCPHCGYEWDEETDSADKTSSCLECGVQEVDPCSSEEDDNLIYHKVKKFSEEYDWVPVFKYEHSGVAYNTTGFSCDWDSALVGIAYVKKTDRDIVDEPGAHESYLKGQVELLHAYAACEVYGYYAEYVDPVTGEHKEDVYYDSCWGFFGDKYIDDIMRDAKSNIDHALEVDNFKLEG